MECSSDGGIHQAPLPPIAQPSLIGVGHLGPAHIGNIIKQLGHEFRDMAITVDDRVAQFGAQLGAGFADAVIGSDAFAIGALGSL